MIIVIVIIIVTIIVNMIIVIVAGLVAGWAWALAISPAKLLDEVLISKPKLTRRNNN